MTETAFGIVVTMVLVSACWYRLLIHERRSNNQKIETMRDLASRREERGAL